MSSAIDEIAATERRPVLVDLALQGGGSHGAFTWGVLDRLLEEPWIRIDAISRDIGGSHERGGAGGRMVQGRG
jgi:NTE family protein